MSRIFPRKIELSCWLLAFPTLYATVPWLQYRFRAIIPFAFVVLWIFVTSKRVKPGFFIPRKLLFLFNRSFWYIVMWTALLWGSQNIWWVFGNGDLMKYHALAGVLTHFIYVFVFYILFRTGRRDELLFLMWLSIIGLGLAGFCAFVGWLTIGAEGTRAIMSAQLLNAAEETLQDATSAVRLGIGTYEFIYACGLAAGPLAYAAIRIKNSFMKFTTFLTLFSCFICVRGSGLGTPMFVFAFGVMLGLSVVVIRKWAFLCWEAGLGVFCLVVFAFFPTIFSFLSSTLSSLAESMDEGSLKMRMESVSEAFSGDIDTYAYKRYELQKDSWNVFLRHPIVGVGAYNYPFPPKKEVGGHSFLFDRLGQQGLVGTLPFLFVMICTFRFLKRCSALGLGYDWLVMPLIFQWCYVFAAIANPVRTLPAFFYIIFPGLAFYFGQDRLSRARRRGGLSWR